MQGIEVEKLPFSELDHIGVAVRDMDRAIEYYQNLGIGPFTESSKRTVIDRTMHGKPAGDVKQVVRFAQIGPIRFELIQPVSGEFTSQEALDRRGEGINHLGFFVDDLDKEVDELVGKGFKVVSSGKFVGGGGFAYLDTDKVGGVLFELIQRSTNPSTRS